MVTILLAAKGNLRVPAITNSVELKDALNKLGAVRSDQVTYLAISCQLSSWVTTLYLQHESDVVTGAGVCCGGALDTTRRPGQLLQG